jgi:hypothetical protein
VSVADAISDMPVAAPAQMHAACRFGTCPFCASIRSTTISPAASSSSLMEKKLSTAPFMAASASGRMREPLFSVFAPPALISGVTVRASRSATVSTAMAVSAMLLSTAWKTTRTAVARGGASAG